MFEGCAEDEDKRYAIPKGHCFAEHTCQRGGCLRMGVLAQLMQLRMDEGSHGELVACHESRDGCGRYVVGNGHSDNWMRRNRSAHRKMGVPKGVSKNGTHGFRHEIQG